MNFKDYIFLKERAYTDGLTPEIEDYINSRFEDIQAKLTALTSDGNRYNVIPAGDGLLDIIDIDKQTVQGKLSYQGKLISSPVVHDNKVSFAIQKDIGDNKREVLGVIYELPAGNNVGTFRVEEPSDRKYQTLMGIEQEEPEEEPEEDETVDTKDTTEETPDETPDEPPAEEEDPVDKEQDEEIIQLKREIEKINAKEKENKRVEAERKEKEELSARQTDLAHNLPKSNPNYTAAEREFDI